MTNVLQILASGSFSTLVGIREGDELEAKGPLPYPLDTAQGRYELAKDVSAFANASGGLIVFGLTTTKVQTENTDEITSVSLVTQSQFQISKIYGVLKSHVFPSLTDVTATWHPSSQDPTLGLGCIRVPKQSEEKKLFLITKVVEEGVALKENVFGIARRVKSDNVPLRAAELHQHIHQGRSPGALRLTRMEEKLDGLFHLLRTIPGSAKPAKAPASMIMDRVNKLLGK